MQLSVDSLKCDGMLDEAKAVEQQDARALLAATVEIGTEAKTEQTALEKVLGKFR